MGTDDLVLLYVVLDHHDRSRSTVPPFHRQGPSRLVAEVEASIISGRSNSADDAITAEACRVGCNQELLGLARSGLNLVESPLLGVARAELGFAGLQVGHRQDERYTSIPRSSQ